MSENDSNEETAGASPLDRANVRLKGGAIQLTREQRVAELRAMSLCWEAIESLTPEQRRRVLWWVGQHVDGGASS